MPVYDYKALDGHAKSVAGIIDADSRQGARQKLQGRGLFPVTIKESRDNQAQEQSQQFTWPNPFTRIRPGEVGMMTRQLATLLGAGFPLVSALESVITQTDSARLQTVLAQLREKIVEGQSMAEALQALGVDTFHATTRGLRFGLLRAVQLGDLQPNWRW